MTETSVVIPTIGRPRQLEAALESLARCRPAATEIVIVTQTDDPEVEAVVARHAEHGARLVHRLGRSIGQAINCGLAAATHDVVFVTNDDCTVAEDWIGVGVRELAGRDDVIVTGAVHAVGDSDAVPSLRDDPERVDYTGTGRCDVIYGANMVAMRRALLAFGAFDERVRPSAEDNDLCYRWLRAGRTILYVPELVIWHHDWRTPEQMADLYLRYGRGQGMFIAKHLRAGDRSVLRFARHDLVAAARSALGDIRRRRRPSDWAIGTLYGMPRGMLSGWRTFRDRA